MKKLFCAAVVSSLAITAISFAGKGAKKGADLVVDPAQIEPYLSVETFAGDDCEVVEGCATTGTRVLLRFTAYTKNQGRRDVKLGDPKKHPDWFTYAPCHDHYHFNGYMNYRLTNNSGEVARGFKAAFCLEDLDQWSPTARSTSRYTCDYQGIQAGWADIYDGSLPCQYIDVTDIADGDYVLEMHVNPDKLVKESNYANNVTTTAVHLEKPVYTPPLPADNDDFLSATIIGPGIYHGDARLATNDAIVSPSCGGSGGDVWFRYTPSADGQTTIATCGSDYDTVLSLFQDNNGSLKEIACNDDTTCNISSLVSQVTAPVTAHISYIIRVSSFGNGGGKYQLTLDGPAKDPTP